MTDEPSNGRATIREVYALVGEVDEKVDAILLAQYNHATRLAVIEKTCKERPAHCALEHAESRRADRAAETDDYWVWVRRWSGVIATTVAVAALIIGLCY